jgi:hypothetical protein
VQYTIRHRKRMNQFQEKRSSVSLRVLLLHKSRHVVDLSRKSTTCCKLLCLSIVLAKVSIDAQHMCLAFSRKHVFGSKGGCNASQHGFVISFLLLLLFLFHLSTVWLLLFTVLLLPVLTSCECNADGGVMFFFAFDSAVAL